MTKNILEPVKDTFGWLSSKSDDSAADKSAVKEMSGQMWPLMQNQQPQKAEVVTKWLTCV